MIFARHLQRAFDGLGPAVGEEDGVGKGRGGQLLRQFFLTGDAKDVRNVPQFSGLPGQRIDQPGVGMAQRVGGDARHAVEKAAAVVGDDPRSLAMGEDRLGAVIDGQQWGYGHGYHPCWKVALAAENCSMIRAESRWVAAGVSRR